MPHGVCPSLPDGATSEGADDSVVGHPIRGEDDADMGTMAIARKRPRSSCTWLGKDACAHERVVAIPHGQVFLEREQE
jgi:hypothetical protein